MNATIIKNDLIDKISKEKYYYEQDLIRFAENDTMKYADVIDEIDSVLEKIALCNAKIQLIKQYFKPISDNEENE